MLVDVGMPLKVLQMAHSLGMHNDCLISENLCDLCRTNLIEAFDFYYSQLPDLASVLDQIIQDIQLDQTGDST